MYKKIGEQLKIFATYVRKKFYDCYKILNKDIFAPLLFYKKEKFFYDLGPKKNIEDGDFYFNRFMTAIEENNKTIAFTGRYGVGKTSVINYVLEKFDGIYRDIRISLGNYEYDKSVLNDNQSSHSNVNVEELEVKILQQIIYTENDSKLPRSRFKRIKYFSNLKKLSLYLVCLLFFILIYTYFPGVLDAIFVPFYSTLSNIIPDKMCLYLCYLYFIILIYLFERLLIFMYSTIDITLLKYKNLEISVSRKDSKSIFNKYLDEILYFFKKTKTHFLVIEDLDRYSSKVSLELFKKLKELNYMLNCNETIKKNGGVVFIYSLRDDLFSQCEDRVKFFDCIIPIVSKFSSMNSKQYIIELYDEFLESYVDDGVNKENRKQLNVVIDKNLFSVLGMYVLDRRLLLNIFMEFKMFIDVLKINQEINFTQLFALISYKNINPKDFDDRLNCKGNLYNIFDLKYDFIELLNKEDSDKIKEYEAQLEEFASSKLRDEEIVKKTFVYDIIRKYGINSGYFNQLYICFGDKKYLINDFVEENINFSGLENIDMFYSYLSIQSKIAAGLVESFVKKMVILKYDTKKIEESIAFYKKKIETNNKLTLMEIFNIEDIRVLLAHNDVDVQKKIDSIFSDKFLVSLVKNGFIKENYENDLSYFKSGDISRSDYSFLVSVDTGDKLDYDYKISNVENVINSIELICFDKENVLNFDICDFFINNKDSKINNYFDKKNNFFSLFKKINAYKFKFLDLYCLHNYDNFKILLSIVFSDAIFSYFYNCDELSSNRNSWVKILIENIELDLCEDNFSMLKGLLEEDIMLFNCIDVCNISIRNIQYLKPTFEDYSKINNDLIAVLYSNDLYIPNISFYNRLIDLYGVKSLYLNSSVIDLLVENPDFNDFSDKVFLSSDFLEFYDNFIVFDSFEKNILSVINKEIPDEYKIHILEKEKNKIKKISSIKDSNLWRSILELDLCEISVENILDYYGTIGKIDSLIPKLLSGISSLNITHEMVNSFEKDLLYVDYNSNINYIDIAETYSYVFEEFDDSKEINELFLNELILNKKVKLNLETYNYLYYKKQDKLLIKLIINYFNDFVSMFDEVETNDLLINNILLCNVPAKEKTLILEKIDISSVPSEILDKIVVDIIDDEVTTDNELNTKLFEFSNFKSRVKLFIYLHKKNKENIKYFYMISNDFKHICDGYSRTATFHFDEDLKLLFEYLKSNYIINSVKEVNGKIKISFKMQKLF